DVLVYDLLNILRLNVAVVYALRVNHNDRAGSAKAEAARADNLDFLVVSRFFQLFMEVLNDAQGIGGRATRARADQHMRPVDHLLNSPSCPSVIFTQNCRWCIP